MPEQPTMFAPSNDLHLLTGYDIGWGYAGGPHGTQRTVFITIEGRLNRTDEISSARIAISAEDAAALAEQLQLAGAQAQALPADYVQYLGED